MRDENKIHFTVYISHVADIHVYTCEIYLGGYTLIL